MEISKSLENLLRINVEDVQKINNSIGSIGDILEYSDLPKKNVVSSLNTLLSYLVGVKNEDIKENILNTILRVMEAKNINCELNLEIVVKQIDKFNKDCISYLLTFLSFSGKKEYRKIIENYLLDEELKEDAEEALIEIDYRIEKSSSR